MKKIDSVKLIYGFCWISILLPWFSYNPRMCGYTWGFDYILFLAVPMFIIGAYAFALRNKKTAGYAAMISAVLNLVIGVLAWGRFDAFTNVKGGWEFNPAVVRFGFPIALLSFTVLLIMLGVNIFNKKRV